MRAAQQQGWEDSSQGAPGQAQCHATRGPRCLQLMGKHPRVKVYTRIPAEQGAGGGGDSGGEAALREDTPTPSCPGKPEQAPWPTPSLPQAVGSHPGKEPACLLLLGAVGSVLLWRLEGLPVYFGRLLSASRDSPSSQCQVHFSEK